MNKYIRRPQQPVSTGSHNNRYSPGYRVNKLNKNSNSRHMTAMIKIGGDASKMMTSTAAKKSWSPAEQRTELCHSVEAGLVCRYGDACKFVHDRSRLPSTLKDLVLLNQIKEEDVMTYRNRPCFDFISTGTCPFGHRCTEIHPPKVHGKSEEKAWLKNLQFPDELIRTDVHVDYNFHGKSAEIHYGDSSLGPKTSKMWDSFGAFSSFVSNTTEEIKQHPVRDYSRSKLSYSQRLHIACLMARPNDRKLTSFKYRPTHVIRDNLCMIVQKRVFRTDRPGSNSPMEEVTSTSHHKHFSWPEQLFVVREILFAHPNSSKDVQHSHGLWINTPSEIIYEVNLARIKSLSRSNKKKISGKPLYDAHEECPFHLFSSTNPDVQELIISVLRYMCQKSFSPLHDVTGEVEFKLMDTFNSLSRSIKASHWPVGEKRDICNLAKIPIVPIDVEYKPSGYHAKTYASFVSNLNSSEIPHIGSYRLDATKIKSKEQDPRLGMFERLAKGGGAPLPPPGLSCGKYSAKIPHVAANSWEDESVIFPNASDWDMVLDHKPLRRAVWS